MDKYTEFRLFIQRRYNNYGIIEGALTVEQLALFNKMFDEFEKEELKS